MEQKVLDHVGTNAPLQHRQTDRQAGGQAAQAAKTDREADRQTALPEADRQTSCTLIMEASGIRLAISINISDCKSTGLCTPTLWLDAEEFPNNASASWREA